MTDPSLPINTLNFFINDWEGTINLGTWHVTTVEIASSTGYTVTTTTPVTDYTTQDTNKTDYTV